MNRGIEHAADVDACDGAAVHAEADEATGEFVHRDEHPVAPERDGLTTKRVDAPQAVSGVADERQPRRSGSIAGRKVILGQDAVHDILIDVDSERVRDDARNPRTVEPRISLLELADGPDECVVRPFRIGLHEARP